MKKKLSFTSNALRDIIGWLNEDYILCIYSNKIQKLYFFKETLDEIVDEKIVYVNLNDDPSLLNDDEWPYYIIGVGFYEYKSIDKLPTKDENIYTLKLDSRI